MYILELLKYLTPMSALRFRAGVRNPDGKIIKIRNWGHSPVFIRNCPSDTAVLSEIIWEDVYGEAISYLKTCNTFVDLGANIGLTSALLREHFPECRILAFEPHPENFKVLQKNVRLGESFQAAVWSSPMKLRLEGDPSLFDRFQAREGGTIDAYSMHQIVSLAGGTIDFMKMDVEGAETELFKDPSWLQHVNLLAIEFHGNSREACQFDHAVQQFGLTLVGQSKHTTIVLRQ